MYMYDCGVYVLNYMELWNGITLLKFVVTVCVLCSCAFINSLRHLFTDIHALFSSIV